jgi:class 3 adenylate cyclase
VPRIEKRGFYLNLKDFPAYVKQGFNIAGTRAEPSVENGPWKVAANKNSRVVPADFVFDDAQPVSKRFFLSPFSNTDREYTIVIPFTFTEKNAAFLSKEPGLYPGIFLAGIGDNWEVYLNGKHIASEIHLNSSGQIQKHKVMRKAAFGFDKSYFKAGINILAFRVIGDPYLKSLGLFYTSPYYIGEYKVIMAENNEIFTLIMIGIYLFMGLYHIYLFLLNKEIKYYLYYGLFSTLFAVYFFSRSFSVYQILHNYTIINKIELFSLFTLIPLCAAFIEQFFMHKISKITAAYGAFFIALSIPQLFLPGVFRENILELWQISALCVIPVFLYNDFIMPIRILTAESKKKSPSGFINVLLFDNSGHIILSIGICFLTAIFDLIDTRYLYYNMLTLRFGFFVFTFGVAAILARHSTMQYRKQQRIIERSNKGMNAKLVDWIIVHDRDPHDVPASNEEKVVMFSDIRRFTELSEGMASSDITQFLISVYELLAKPMYTSAGDRASYTDKFIGDCMMNIFVDPNAALKTAVIFRSQLDMFNANPDIYLKDVKIRTPRIDIGTGIAFGEVTMGVMGHSRRLDYTPIGDTVNVASRLEGLTKEYHTPILLNNNMYHVINKNIFTLRHIDRIRVKGKKIPVDIYEEFSNNPPIVRDAKLEMQPQITELQSIYFSGKNLDDALNLARSIIRQYDDIARRFELSRRKPIDYLPGICVARIRHLRADPRILERWDGVYTFTEK